MRKAINQILIIVAAVAIVEIVLAVAYVPLANPMLLFGLIFGTAIIGLIGFCIFAMTTSNLAAIRALREGQQQQFQGYQQALSAVMYLSERQAQTVERAFQAGA